MLTITEYIKYLNVLYNNYRLTDKQKIKAHIELKIKPNLKIK